MRLQTTSCLAAVILAIAAGSVTAPASPLARATGSGIALPDSGILLVQDRDRPGGGDRGVKSSSGGDRGGTIKSGGDGGGGGDAKATVRHQAPASAPATIQRSVRTEGALQAEARVRSGHHVRSGKVVVRSGPVVRHRTVFVHRRVHHRRFIRHRRFFVSPVVVVHSRVCHRHIWHGHIFRHAHRYGGVWHRHGRWRYAGRCYRVY